MQIPEDNLHQLFGLDCSEHTEIYYDYDNNIRKFMVHDEAIYYSRNNYDDLYDGIYSIDIASGNEKKLVATFCDNFTFYDGKLLYEGDSNSSIVATYAYDFDLDSTVLVFEGKISYPCIIDEYVFFLASNNIDYARELTRMNLRTLETETYEPRTLGRTVVTDQYIFFVDERDWSIYRSDKDGRNIIKLTSGYCRELYVHENTVLYIGYANGYSDESVYVDGVFAKDFLPYGLFAVDFEGEEARWVDKEARYDSVFYKNNTFNIRKSNIYSKDIGVAEQSTNNKPILTENINNKIKTIFTIADDWIYCSIENDNDQSALARIYIDGSRVEYLYDNNVYNLKYYDKMLYFCSYGQSQQFIKMRTDGTNESVITTEPISEYVIQDDWIYYIDRETQFINKIRNDGTGQRRLNEVSSAFIQVEQSKIYFTNMYDKGKIYEMDLEGNNSKIRVDLFNDYSDHTNYFTFGVDDYKKAEKPTVEYAADEILSFEDSEFERFLCAMFNKEPGTITGSDLLSVRFFGYYDGHPQYESDLKNLGANVLLEKSMIYFNTSSLSYNIDVPEIMFDEASGDTLTYRNECIKMSVISRDWMSEHVLKYMYYFKNLEAVLLAYFELPDELNLPEGAGYFGISIY